MGTNCGESLLFKEKQECIGKEARGFKHSKTAKVYSVRVSLLVIWFLMMVLRRITASFLTYWCTFRENEY